MITHHAVESNQKSISKFVKTPLNALFALNICINAVCKKKLKVKINNKIVKKKNHKMKNKVQR